ncbi:MAG: hypothetical protein MPJ50_07495 [Pirellulales bacterium]|nr:hypothetical protein [Pirellulales bacterium]
MSSSYDSAHANQPASLPQTKQPGFSQGNRANGVVSAGQMPLDDIDQASGFHSTLRYRMRFTKAVRNICDLVNEDTNDQDTGMSLHLKFPSDAELAVTGSLRLPIYVVNQRRESFKAMEFHRRASGQYHLRLETRDAGALVFDFRSTNDRSVVRELGYPLAAFRNDIDFESGITLGSLKTSRTLQRLLEIASVNFVESTSLSLDEVSMKRFLSVSEEILPLEEEIEQMEAEVQILEEDIRKRTARGRKMESDVSKSFGAKGSLQRGVGKLLGRKFRDDLAARTHALKKSQEELASCRGEHFYLKSEMDSKRQEYAELADECERLRDSFRRAYSNFLQGTVFRFVKTDASREQEEFAKHTVLAEYSRIDMPHFDELAQLELVRQYLVMDNKIFLQRRDETLDLTRKGDWEMFVNYNGEGDKYYISNHLVCDLIDEFLDIDRIEEMRFKIGHDACKSVSGNVEERVFRFAPEVSSAVEILSDS